jgi:hypothetical protein
MSLTEALTSEMFLWTDTIMYVSTIAFTISIA